MKGCNMMRRGDEEKEDTGRRFKSDETSNHDGGRGAKNDIDESVKQRGGKCVR